VPGGREPQDGAGQREGEGIGGRVGGIRTGRRWHGRANDVMTLKCGKGGGQEQEEREERKGWRERDERKGKKEKENMWFLNLSLFVG
jgi:hypothetical protein